MEVEYGIQPADLPIDGGDLGVQNEGGGDIGVQNGGGDIGAQNGGGGGGLGVQNEGGGDIGAQNEGGGGGLGVQNEGGGDIGAQNGGGGGGLGVPNENVGGAIQIPVDEPRFAGVLGWMDSNPAPYVVWSKPRFFFYPCVFERVYFKIYPIVMVILSTVFFTTDVLEKEGVMALTAVTTIIFVFLSSLMFILDGIYICFSNRIPSEYTCQIWCNELLINVFHIMCAGCVINSAFITEKKIEGVGQKLLLAGLIISISGIVLRVANFIGGCCKLKQITKNPEEMLLIAAGKGLEKAILDYEEAYTEMNEKLMGQDAKQDSLGALDLAIRNTLSGEMERSFQRPVGRPDG